MAEASVLCLGMSQPIQDISLQVAGYHVTSNKYSYWSQDLNPCPTASQSITLCQLRSVGLNKLTDTHTAQVKSSVSYTQVKGEKLIKRTTKKTVT